MYTGSNMFVRKIVFHMRNFFGGPRRSARALIVRDNKLLAFRRKRYDRKAGEWLEYYSIPGGGIEPGEKPEQAAVRELREEMGIDIKTNRLVAHRYAKDFEHYVYSADIISGTPELQMDSEEAMVMNEYNQFAVEWVDIDKLTVEGLRYYSDYLEIIQQLGDGNHPDSPSHFKA